MRRAVHVALLFTFLLASMSGAMAQQLRIAAAADLQPALPSVLDEWQKRTGHKAEVSYASSAVLTQQIENGAPFDLFLSADMGYPQQLSAKGLADQPTPYAQGTLVLWARKGSPAQPLTVAGLKATIAGKIQRLAVANPSHAPYGRAAQAYLTNTKLADVVKDKLVTAENIGQTAEFAEFGNAQAGLISLTSALTEKFQKEGTFVVIPRDDYPPILQGGAVLTHAQNKQLAQQFYAFMRSPFGQFLLKSRGLVPPPAEPAAKPGTPAVK